MPTYNGTGDIQIRTSIRLRFGIWTAGFLLATLVAVGGVVFASVERTLYSLLDESLRVTSSEAIAAMNIEGGRIIVGDGSLREIASAPGDRQYSLRLIDLSTGADYSFGDFSGVSPEQKSHLIARQRERYFGDVAGRDGRRLRIYTVPVIERNRILGIMQVGHSTASVRRTLSSLLATLGMIAPVLGLVAGLGGYFLARRALDPIDRIAEAARLITAESLHRRLNVMDAPKEVARLAATFDDMIGRLDASFQRERQFTSDVSHELRTPLTAMHAIVDYLLEGERDTEDRAAALNDLDAEVSRLRALTEQMLSLVRSEQSAGSVHADVDLSMILGDLVDSMSPVAEAKSLRMERSIEPGLWVAGSEDDLIRVFMNVVENAIKYTDVGSIVVSAEPKGDEQLLVTVSDTGIGISEEDRSRVFDRFFRSERSRSIEGTGLGLSIAKRLVENMGGSIGVESGPGEGSTFAVTLPVARGKGANRAVTKWPRVRHSR